ncbi:predicted protein, partial [Nematostella vectensis]
KIEIFVQCTDLVQLDKFSKSDPLCVLSVKKLGHWTEFGRTESLPNNLSPKFVESFVLEPSASLYPRLRFSLYDLANFTSKDLRKHDFIGCTEIDIDSLLSAESPYVRTLRVPGDIQTRGFIKLFYEEVHTSLTNVRFQISGVNLEKRSLLSKWDVFFELERLLPGGFYHPVYRSEIVARTLDPRWSPFDIYLQKLCNEEVTREAVISCWHYSSSGANTLIASARCPVGHLINRSIKVLQLVKPQKTQKARRAGTAGSLRIDHCHVDKHFSLVDYIRGGCDVTIACAIDFTLSNGDPSCRSSLHTLSCLYQNEYIGALRALGPVLMHYDEDKQIPTFAFGAKSKHGIPYCFALNGDESEPEISSIETLIDTYTRSLTTIKLGGPTYLVPVIKRLADYATRELSQDSQHYLVAMVIMDGVANDLDDTKEQIIQVSGLPLSIVVVGVGPADFTAM